jgi:hypothetical protein
MQVSVHPRQNNGVFFVLWFVGPWDIVAFLPGVYVNVVVDKLSREMK